MARRKIGDPVARTRYFNSSIFYKFLIISRALVSVLKMIIQQAEIFVSSISFVRANSKSIQELELLLPGVF